jgi:DNA-binding XRE family transcriptional regulator
MSEFSSLPMMIRASEPPMKDRRVEDECRLAKDTVIATLQQLIRSAGSLSILKVSIAMKSKLKVSIRQVKAARALLDWSQEQLASAADVSIPTIKRLEANDGPLGGRGNTVEKILNAMEAAGVEFINENGGGPGVRLRKGHRTKP